MLIYLRLSYKRSVRLILLKFGHKCAASVVLQMQKMYTVLRDRSPMR